MKYIKEEKILLENPFVIRPGAKIILTVKAIRQIIENWDIATTYSKELSGIVFAKSIKSDKLIPFENIDIDYNSDTDVSTVTILPISETSITTSLTIYHNVTEIFSLTTKSALSASESDSYNLENYEYIIKKNNSVIPMTLIDVPDAFDDYVETLDISLSKPERRGITSVLDGFISINSQGKVDDTYVLRKGVEFIFVPDVYKGRYMRRIMLNNEYVKEIEIENQESIVPQLEFFGIENVGEVIFIMTSNGLYGFNMHSDFIDPIDENGVIFSWPDIKGTDITYISDDSLVIPSGVIMNKYYLRHDMALIDRNLNKIFFREPFPDFFIS